MKRAAFAFPLAFAGGLLASAMVSPRPAGGGETVTLTPADPEELRRLEEAVGSLRAEINLWNLVNGLQLTPHQLVHVLAGARAARAVREESAPAPDARSLEEAARRLAEARKALIEGREPPEGALRAADVLEGRRKGPSKDPAAVRRRILQIEDEVSAVLLDSQKEVLRTYKPCLLPPKDLKDPVRVGQASDATPYLHLIDRAVSIPAERWAGEGAALVAAALEGEQKHNGRYDPAELERRRSTIRSVLEEARALSPGDRMLRRDSLAECLQPEDKPQRLLDELASTTVGGRVPGKVARFLLDERIVPILELRLQQRLTAKRTPTSLEAIEAAESCLGGHCALTEPE